MIRWLTNDRFTRSVERQ